MFTLMSWFFKFVALMLMVLWGVGVILLFFPTLSFVLALVIVVLFFRIIIS